MSSVRVRAAATSPAPRALGAVLSCVSARPCLNVWKRLNEKQLWASHPHTHAPTHPHPRFRPSPHPSCGHVACALGHTFLLVDCNERSAVWSLRVVAVTIKCSWLPDKPRPSEHSPSARALSARGSGMRSCVRCTEIHPRRSPPLQVRNVAHDAGHGHQGI
jgi:hypothetical protein